MVHVIEKEHLARCPFCGGKTVKMATGAWNRRSNAKMQEQERKVYVNPLSVAEMAPILEAVKLYDYSDYSELRFCRNMARVYGCKPLEADGDNLDKFLITLYHYGKVQGIRQERARHKEKVNREVMKIAQALKNSDSLYRVMKIAIGIEDKGELKQAVEFLKGAKKHED